MIHARVRKDEDMLDHFWVINTQQGQRAFSQFSPKAHYAIFAGHLGHQDVAQQDIPPANSDEGYHFHVALLVFST